MEQRRHDPCLQSSPRTWRHPISKYHVSCPRRHGRNRLSGLPLPSFGVSEIGRFGILRRRRRHLSQLVGRLLIFIPRCRALRDSVGKGVGRSAAPSSTSCDRRRIVAAATSSQQE